MLIQTGLSICITLQKAGNVKIINKGELEKGRGEMSEVRNKMEGEYTCMQFIHHISKRTLYCWRGKKGHQDD